MLHPLSHSPDARLLPDERSAQTGRKIRARQSVGSIHCALAGGLAIWAAIGSLFAQTPVTTINLATQTRNADFSAFNATRPVQVGATLPSTCALGQLFFHSSATPGSNLYGCTAVNTWTPLGGGAASTSQVSLAPASLSFGNQTSGTTSNAATVTLTDTGTAYLSVTAITVSGPNASDFVVANTCGSIVASGAVCTISVSFKPTTVGPESATLNVNGNQLASPATLAMTGTGTGAVTSGGLVITPSAVYAGENGTVSFTSNRAVNWSLATGSSGTLTSSSPTAATYQAPLHIPAQNVVGSCQATPNDSVFNTRIDNLPVESRSATWTANMGTNGISLFTSWGTNIANSGTPLTSESFYYTTGNNGPFVTPKWPAVKREDGAFTTTFNDTDHHVMTVQKDNCQFYELYNDWLGPHTCRDGVTPGCTATSGVTYSWSSYGLPANGSTDAAGLPLAPLMLHIDEVRSGAVHHAMRFTVAGGFIQALPYWPANSGNGCASCTNSPPYGARFRLKANYDISSFSPYAKTILTALKQYGMFLADAGTGPTITVSTDLSEDSTATQAMAQIAGANIKMSSFEAVDESSFQVSAGSAQVNPQNGYQIPSGFAVVNATDQSNLNYRVAYPVPLQSVVVGLPSPSLTIVAGTPGYQLSSWVTGTSNQNVTWSLASGSGAVTPAGLFTPPSSVSGATTADLVATSAADANSSATMHVQVLPAGINPAGSIRIDVGSSTGVTDGNGKLWLADTGFENGGYVQLNGDYPSWPNQSNPEMNVYQSSGYSYGNDLVYTLAVPNGNYKVRLMFGQPYNSCWPACSGQTFDPSWHIPLHLEANGQIGSHNFNMGIPASFQYATPVDQTIPAWVKDNNLVIAVRANIPDTNASSKAAPLLNGIEILPDSTAPHITIDSQQQTTVGAGSRLQLYSIGWYMSGAATWSASGPGTIDQTGLYTAPASATAAAQTVTVTATSVASPEVKATVTLTVPGTGS